MTDIFVRAVKTFIQAFFGILIPELCVVFSEGVPDMTFVQVILPPLFCSALAAGISAVWNYLAKLLDESLAAPHEELVAETLDNHPSC